MAADVLTRPVLALRKGDILSGEDVVPGFSYPIADLFAVSLRPQRKG